MSTRRAAIEQTQQTEKPAAVVKKYANRRLYNTATSSYVTLDELSHMVRRGEDFVVYDAKTNDDITRSVLTQIILEEDSKGRNLLPIGFLRQLIGFYDDQLHAFLPRYLEVSMENFAKNQEQIRSYVQETFGRFFPITQFEDMARQNMALFQRAASSMWRPLAAEGGALPSAEQGEPVAAAPEAAAATAAAPDLSGQMRELENRLETLQRQLEKLSRTERGESVPTTSKTA
jgi:polyhydroxyalkanoate synthesis repressor PhaR